MSGPLEMDLMPQPEHNSLPATRSRESIVATIRRRTSRIFGRDVPDMPENTASSIPAGPLGNKRSWFDSIGARFSRKDQAAPELEQQSSQDARVELREVAGTSSTSSTASTTTPTGSSPSGTSPARSHQKRRFLRGGRAFKLQSLPAKFRRGGAAIFRWSSSSGSSTDDKEDAPMLNAANTRVVSTGSWNSFRIGVPKNPREPPLTRPPLRAPLRTLWTIMSADSSEGQGTPDISPYAVPPNSAKSWSSNWSHPSSNRLIISPTSGNDDVMSPLSGAATCSMRSPTSAVLSPTTHETAVEADDDSMSGDEAEGEQEQEEGEEQHEGMSPVSLSPVLQVLREVQNKPAEPAPRAAEGSESRAEQAAAAPLPKKEDIRPVPVETPAVTV